MNSLPFHDRGRYHIETSPLIWFGSMDWFLYDIGLRHERIKLVLFQMHLI